MSTIYYESQFLNRVVTNSRHTFQAFRVLFKHRYTLVLISYLHHPESLMFEFNPPKKEI